MATITTRSRECCAWLFIHGVNKGDRLGIWSANSKEWIICFLAAAQIGIPVVCINFHLKKESY
ncbi:AMP-binding protein [Proteus mirabilis]